MARPLLMHLLWMRLLFTAPDLRWLSFHQGSKEMIDEVDLLLEEAVAVTDRRRLRETTELREKSRENGTGYKGNRQAFQNRDPNEVALQDPDRLHTGKAPNLAIINERPEHYILLVALAKGATQRELAEASGYSESWISQIVRQPWAKQRLLDILEKGGINQVEAVLRLEVMPSIMTLVEIRDDPQSGAKARITASQDLLNRSYLGTPIQRVENYKGGEVVSTRDKEVLDARIAEAQAEIARLEGKVEAGK